MTKDFKKYLEERQDKKLTSLKSEEQEQLEWDKSVENLYSLIKSWFENQEQISISEKNKNLVMVFNGTDKITIDPKMVRLQIIGYGINIIGPKGNGERIGLDKNNDWIITDADKARMNIENAIPGGKQYKQEKLTEKSFEELIKRMLD